VNDLRVRAAGAGGIVRPRHLIGRFGGSSASPFDGAS
jgi:hypothetical protein